MANERVDADGVWRLGSDGVTEMLVEPSQAYLDRRAALASELEAAEPVTPDPVVVAADAIRDEITERLQPSGVNSIAEVKAAVIQGLDAAVARLQ